MNDNSGWLPHTVGGTHHPGPKLAILVTNFKESAESSSIDASTVSLPGWQCLPVLIHSYLNPDRKLPIEEALPKTFVPLQNPESSYLQGHLTSWAEWSD